MATWHQQRANVRLYHETKWTVVEDPPNGLRTLCICDTEQQANDWRDRAKALHPKWSIYVLRPATPQRPA